MKKLSTAKNTERNNIQKQLVRIKRTNKKVRRKHKKSLFILNQSPY